MKPKFIAIEGGEGSGKSTLTKALKELLGDRAVFTREPGGTPYAEKIRELALKEPLAKGTPGETTLCLMFAARFDHLPGTITAALDRGANVITDRFDGSSFALNVHAQSEGRLEPLFWELRKNLIRTPDLYIFIDVDPREGARRAQARNIAAGAAAYDHFDDRHVDFHAKVREGYLKFFRQVSHIVIDANRPLAEVKHDFLEQVQKTLV